LGAPRAGVQVMVDRLLQCRTFAGFSERALIGNLKQVLQFMKDMNVKERVFSHLDEEIDASTRVLIGHSLGSVVGYEYLCRYKPNGVQSLITLGSPLGIPNVIFDQLSPAPLDGTGAWPGAVKRWVNIADLDDVIALRKRLTELFAPPPDVEPIIDLSVDNGGRFYEISAPHAIRPYLSSVETGAALATALEG
jgi:pimeloyl-ACP methyl ester carboxylesterase